MTHSSMNDDRMRYSFFDLWLLFWCRITSALFPWFGRRIYIFALMEYEKTKEFKRKLDWGVELAYKGITHNPDTLVDNLLIALKTKFFKSLIPLQTVIVEPWKVFLLNYLFEESKKETVG